MTASCNTAYTVDSYRIMRQSQGGYQGSWPEYKTTTEMSIERRPGENESKHQIKSTIKSRAEAERINGKGNLY